MGDRLRKVMSIANKIKYRRSLKSRVKLRIQIVISNFIMRMWNKYLRKVLIALILISYGVTGTVIFILLSASHKVIINTAEAEEVSGVARELNPRDKTTQVEIIPQKVDGDVVASLIRKTFPECPEMALKVAECESSMDSQRIGDTHMKFYSYGLFQINTTWHKYSKEVLLDPVENIKIARKIYDESGGNWNRWTCGRRLANQSI